MNKNQIISARILSLIAQGYDVKAAVNSVLGEGTFEKLASDVYDELRQAA